MIDLELLINSNLSSQDIYDIINIALDIAVDDGFFNNFVFERALYNIVAAYYQNDNDDDIAIAIQEVMNNPLTVFDTNLKEGVFGKVLSEYSTELKLITDAANVWVKDYIDYSTSIAGALNGAEELTNTLMDNMVNQFKDVAGNGQVLEALKIADEWGLNRTPPDLSAAEAPAADPTQLFEV